MDLFPYDPLLVQNGRVPMPGATVKFYALADTNRLVPLEVFTMTGVSLGKEPRADSLGYINNAAGYQLPVLAAVSQSGAYPPRPVYSIPSIIEEASAIASAAASSAGEASAARTAAEDALAAAADAAAAAKAPADEAVARVLTTEGSAASEALAGALLPKLDKAAAEAAFALKPDNGGKPVGKGELMVNVRDFGAKGDGIADDHDAIQAAVNSLSTTGGTIYFPPGEYVAHAAIILSSSVHITGSHAATLRKTTGQTDYCYFVVKSGSRLGYGGGGHDITITNLVFRGNLAAGRSLCAITAHRLSGLYVSNCKFFETSQNGHVIDLLGCESVIIENSEFRGSKPTTGRGYVEAVQIDSSIVSAAGWAASHTVGEVFDGTPTRNVTVRKCTFGGITVEGIRYGSPSPIGSHAYVEGRAYTGIRFEDNDVSEVVSSLSDNYSGIIHFIGARDVKIARNTIDCGGIPNAVVRMYSGASAHRVSDANNPDASTFTPSVYITPEDVEVVDNTILNGAGGTILWAYGAAGQMAGKVTFSRNKFQACLVGDTVKSLMEITRAKTALFGGNETVGCGGAVIVTSGNGMDTQVLDNISDGSSGRFADLYAIERLVVNRNVALNQADGMKIGANIETVVTDNVLSVKTAVACLQLGSPSSPRSIRVSRNNLSSSATAAPPLAVSIATGYTKGIVTENQSVNYGACVGSVPTGVSSVNNLTL